MRKPKCSRRRRNVELAGSIREHLNEKIEPTCSSSIRSPFIRRPTKCRLILAVLPLAIRCTSGAC